MIGIYLSHILLAIVAVKLLLFQKLFADLGKFLLDKLFLLVFGRGLLQFLHELSQPLHIVFGGHACCNTTLPCRP